MKTLLTILFATSSIAAQADVTVKTVEDSTRPSVADVLTAQNSTENQWTDLDSICFSNSSSSSEALKTCNDAQETLNLLSNDKVVFQVRCDAGYKSFCRHYNAAVLSTKVLFLGN